MPSETTQLTYDIIYSPNAQWPALISHVWKQGIGDHWDLTKIVTWQVHSREVYKNIFWVEWSGSHVLYYTTSQVVVFSAVWIL